MQKMIWGAQAHSSRHFRSFVHAKTGRLVDRIPPIRFTAAWLLALACLCMASPSRATQLTGNFLLTQCRAEVARALAASRAEFPQATNHEASLVENANNFAAQNRKAVEENNAHFIRQVAINQREFERAHNYLGLCYSRVALSTFGTTASTQTTVPSAKLPPRPQPPAATRTATPNPFPTADPAAEKVRLAARLDTALDRFENGARDYMEEPRAEDAKDCVRIVWGGYYDGAKLINRCPEHSIEAIWCVDGVDCRPTFSNQTTLHFEPNSYSYARGTSQEGYGRLVHFGACVAGDDIDYRTTPPLQYRCKVRRK